MATNEFPTMAVVVGRSPFPFWLPCLLGAFLFLEGCTIASVLAKRQAPANHEAADARKTETNARNVTARGNGNAQDAAPRDSGSGSAVSRSDPPEGSRPEVAETDSGDFSKIELASLDDGKGAEGRIDPALLPFLREAARIAERQGEHLAATSHWRAAWHADESDVEAAIGYIGHLRRLGKGGAAVHVARKSLGFHPRNTDLRLEYAKSLIVGGRGRDAQTELEALEALRPGDPKISLALGLSLDSQGKHAQAYEIYRAAMQEGAASPELLNNAAISRALENDLDTAQSLLERALDAAGDDSQMLQNLAFVLWLKGDAARAESITRQNLPDELAEKTLAFYRGFTNQRDVWGERSQGKL